MTRYPFPRRSKHKPGATPHLKQETIRRRGAPLGNQNARKRPVPQLPAQGGGMAETMPVKDRAIALANAQKAKLISLQVRLMERALNSTDWDFNPTTLEELSAFQLDIAHRHLQRVISPQDYAFAESDGWKPLQDHSPRPAGPAGRQGSYRYGVRQHSTGRAPQGQHCVHTKASAGRADRVVRKADKRSHCTGSAHGFSVSIVGRNTLSVATNWPGRNWREETRIHLGKLLNRMNVDRR